MNTVDVRASRNAMIIALMIVAAISLRIFKGPQFLDDPFHHGEYFAATMSFFDSGISDVIPLTIHGALDFLPAMLARLIWGDEGYFLPTYAIYQVLNFVSAILFVGIIWRSVGERKYKGWIASAAGLAAPFLVGYRDVFLLGAILIFLALADGAVSKWSSRVLKVVLGFLLGGGLFWSYDRGMAGGISIGLGILAHSTFRKKEWISPVSFFMTVFLVGFVNDFFSLEHYFENVQFLVETSSQWSYGLKGWPLALTLYAIFLNIFSLALYWRALIKEGAFAQRLGEVITLSALSVFMLKISLNRADIWHIFWSMWMPFVIATRMPASMLPEGGGAKFWVVLLFVSSSLLAVIFEQLLPLLIILPILWLLGVDIQVRWITLLQVLKGLVTIGFLAAIGSGMRAYSKDAYGWMVRVLDRPSNYQVVDASLVWVSRKISDSHANCVFDMSNNGLINGLANLPSCTRFTYPVYATEIFEEEIINTLQEKRPPSVVYSSTIWSYKIDGRSMAERFPLLDQYLRSRYSIQECSHGYCVGRMGD